MICNSDGVNFWGDHFSWRKTNLTKYWSCQKAWHRKRARKELGQENKRRKKLHFGTFQRIFNSPVFAPSRRREKTAWEVGLVWASSVTIWLCSNTCFWLTSETGKRVLSNEDWLCPRSLAKRPDRKSMQGDRWSFQGTMNSKIVGD